MPNRIKLVPMTGVKSAYPLAKADKLDVSVLKDGAQCVPELRDALLALRVAVESEGGDLQITDLFRPWAMQAKLREEYEKSVTDPNIKDKAFAAKPGGSFHQAGRAVDISIQALKFKNVAPDLQLDKLWALAKPLGFKPIIRIPDERMSECWHFDFPSSTWEAAYSKLNYSEVAKCAMIDAGCWDPNEKPTKLDAMFVQAQLIRLGFYEIGSVDGVIGSKTLDVLKKMGLDKATMDVIGKTLADRK